MYKEGCFTYQTNSRHSHDILHPNDCFGVHMYWSGLWGEIFAFPLHLPPFWTLLFSQRLQWFLNILKATESFILQSPFSRIQDYYGRATWQPRQALCGLFLGWISLRPRILANHLAGIGVCHLIDHCSPPDQGPNSANVEMPKRHFSWNNTIIKGRGKYPATIFAFRHPCYTLSSKPLTPNFCTKVKHLDQCSFIFCVCLAGWTSLLIHSREINEKSLLTWKPFVLWIRAPNPWTLAGLRFLAYRHRTRFNWYRLLLLITNAYFSHLKSDSPFGCPWKGR